MPAAMVVLEKLEKKMTLLLHFSPTKLYVLSALRAIDEDNIPMDIVYEDYPPVSILS